MHALLRGIPALAAFAVAVVVASWLGPCMELDSCVDNGGTFDPETGLCTVEAGRLYRSQLSRPGLYAFWAIFLATVLVPALAAKWLLIRLLRKSGCGAA